MNWARALHNILISACLATLGTAITFSLSDCHRKEFIENNKLEIAKIEYSKQNFEVELAKARNAENYKIVPK